MRLNLKSKSQFVEDDDADLFEMKSNLNFNKSSIIAYIQLIISFVALLLIVFGHGSNRCIVRYHPLYVDHHTFNNARLFQSSFRFTLS